MSKNQKLIDQLGGGWFECESTAWSIADADETVIEIDGLYCVLETRYTEENPIGSEMWLSGEIMQATEALTVET